MIYVFKHRKLDWNPQSQTDHRTDLRIGEVKHFERVVELPLVGDVRGIGVHFAQNLDSFAAGSAVPRLLAGQADWCICTEVGQTRVREQRSEVRGKGLTGVRRSEAGT